LNAMKGGLSILIVTTFTPRLSKRNLPKT